MCSQYRVEFNPNDIDDFYFSDKDAVFGEPRFVTPYSLAPVITGDRGEVHLEMMRFGLLPRWSKEARLKFSTHNARLDTIESKASFKDAFVKRHCLVPISTFIEAIYHGDLAGNMIGFHAEGKVLMAAGIWEEWRSPKEDETVRSFSILTDDPYPFVLEKGHDRSPVFVDRPYWLEWLQNKALAPIPLKDELRRHRLEPILQTKIERPLKDGWKKRI